MENILPYIVNALCFHWYMYACVCFIVDVSHAPLKKKGTRKKNVAKSTDKSYRTTSSSILCCYEWYAYHPRSCRCRSFYLWTWDVDGISDFEIAKVTTLATLQTSWILLCDRIFCTLHFCLFQPSPPSINFEQLYPKKCCWGRDWCLERGLDK